MKRVITSLFPTIIFQEFKLNNKFAIKFFINFFPSEINVFQQKGLSINSFQQLFSNNQVSESSLKQKILGIFCRREEIFLEDGFSGFGMRKQQIFDIHYAIGEFRSHNEMTNFLYLVNL
jgi:hypothetical protein